MYLCLHAFSRQLIEIWGEGYWDPLHTSPESSGPGGQDYVHTAQATASLKDPGGWK